MLAIGYLTAQFRPCFAQSDPPAKIEHYSTEDGLSHDVVTTIMKDHEGYMWFGTWYGLNRFDGNHFTSFKSIAGDSSQIKNNRIDQITEGYRNVLWVKAYDGQIYRFDKTHENFRSLAAILKLPGKVEFEHVLAVDKDDIWVSIADGGVIHIPDIYHRPTNFIWYKKNADGRRNIPSNKTNCFLKDQNRNVWLGTPAGLVYLKHTRANSYDAPITLLSKKSGLNITALSECSDRLFFASATGSLYSYTKRNCRFKEFMLSNQTLNNLLVSSDKTSLYVTSAAGELVTLSLKDDTWHKYTSPYKQALHSMFQDSHQNLWIEPEQTGILKFDANKRFKAYTQNNDSKNINAGNHFKVFEDINGLIWCVLRDGGFGYYDTASDNINYFHNQPGSKDRAFSNLVTVAYYDPSGVMWLHTDEHGVEKIIFQPKAFENRLVKNNAIFKSDNEIRAVCVDRTNRTWICAKAGPIYWLQDGRLLPGKFSNADQYKIGAVYSIIEDRHGNIWMGTKTNGLFEAIPNDTQCSSYRLINFIHHQNDINSISSDQIYAIKEDANGQIWVGAFDHGLNLLQKAGNKISFRRISDGQYGYPKDFEKIRVIEIDNKGNLWLGTTEGLLILQQRGDNYSFSSYNKRPGDKTSIGNNDIQHIHRDHLGRMWLSTSGGGLALAQSNQHNNTLSFRSFTTANGLANDYVLSCTEDNAGKLWIATKSSISRMDPITWHIKNFSSYDGLSTDGFSESTCGNTRDGKLIFGTTRGYLEFDPQDIVPHPINANLVFTNLQVNNQWVGIADSSGILKQSINHTEAITLHYSQNVVSVDYSMLDYRFGSSLPFVYRLKGFDNEWHNNSNQLRATYTNIPAGHYLLEIKCPDADRYGNVPYKSLAITVLPAPWLSWWAYLLYAAVIAAIALVIWRNTMTAFKLKQKLAIDRELTELKLGFFTNISHELRTPLMLILNPITQLAKLHAPDQLERQYIDIVERNANRMVRFVNQLLEFRKLQSGKPTLDHSSFEMAGFIRNIAANFEDVRMQKSINLEITGYQAPLHVQYDQDKIETVIYNLLSNAFKFTADGRTITVNMAVKTIDQQLELTVTDQGCGVPDNELKLIFELYHSDQRSAVKNSKGTGIGLALSKELVELHGGTITAVNVPSGGLCVKITLPLIRANKPESAAINSSLVINELGTLDNISQVVPEPPVGAPLLMLVEDNADMREFLRMQLSEIYRVETAADGMEGLEKVRQLMPDIIVSDVMMPVMDGITLIDTLKNDPVTSHIPVVLMSARSAVEHQIIGLNYGADYYLAKPFQNELLIAAIDGILERRKKMFEKLTVDKRVVNLSPCEIIVTSKDEAFLKNVIQIIGDKMADPDFDIDTVAETVNMARATFYKKFKSLTQIAPVEFVRDMRLQRAKQYFDAGHHNVAEVGYTVGFSSPKYFSTCYKSKYRIAPSDYIRSVKTPVETAPAEP